jgi:hypothetical protein
LADAAQQGISTAAHCEFYSSACTSSSTQSKTNDSQSLIKPQCAPALASYYLWQAIAEDALLTSLIKAEELAGMQP